MDAATRRANPVIAAAARAAPKRAYGADERARVIWFNLHRPSQPASGFRWNSDRLLRMSARSSGALRARNTGASPPVMPDAGQEFDGAIVNRKPAPRRGRCQHCAARPERLDAELVSVNLDRKLQIWQ